MRCETVQALWAAPPLHQVVATAVLNDPPTVYTGGSDGAIVWWKLSSTSASSQLEIWPVAMLCGHAAAVADLEICTPGKDYKMTQSLTDNFFISEASQALISACVDGVLCIWSSLSGHCKRRRKLPPWVGSPSVLSSLPNFRRYVCIACTCANAGQVQRSHTDEMDEGNEAGKSTKESTLERQTSLKMMSKGAIVIVDSLTLNILQIIFHGLLSIGPVKSLVVAPDMVSENSKLVIASDLYGRIQVFTLNEENNMTSEAGNNLEKSDQTYLASLGSTNVVIDEVKDVSIASDGKLLLLVSRNQWTIKSTIEGSILIDESCVDSLLCRSDTSDETFLAGGMFLTDDGCERDELKEPQPIDWEYYRKGIGSRLVDMYKEAYENVKIPKYVDKVTPEYKPKFDALLKEAKQAEINSLQESERLEKEIAKIQELKKRITTMTADEYFAEYPELKARFDEEIKNDNWGY